MRSMAVHQIVSKACMQLTDDCIDAHAYVFPARALSFSLSRERTRLYVTKAHVSFMLVNFKLSLNY